MKTLIATAPLDLSVTASELASYVAGTAVAGLLVAGAVWAIRVIVRAFKTVADDGDAGPSDEDIWRNSRDLYSDRQSWRDDHPRNR